MIDVGKAILYKIIREGLMSGLPAYRVLGIARKHGVKIATKTFYHMWNEVKKGIEVMEWLSEYDPSKPIPWYQYVKTSYNFPSKYVHVVEGMDAVTGQTVQFGIYTNRTLSEWEIYERAGDIALEQYGVTLTNIKIKSLCRT